MNALFRPAYDAAPLPLRLGLLTPHNTLDRRAFSGTAFHAARALAATPGITLRRIGPHHRRPMFYDRILPREAPAFLPVPQDLDMVVGLVASPFLDRLARTSGLPFLHVTDATPAFLREVYGWSVPESADVCEGCVARAAARAVYSSPYMAERASRELSLPPGQAVAVPFGINLDTPGDLPSGPPPTNGIELLFVGTDWDRKGGDMAVAALEQLIARGRRARLTVVGRAPDALTRHPHVVTKGFLDKNRPRHRAEMIRLYRQAHVFLLPTRADCTPMVLAEAMAHGTPVVASDIGGVGDLIGDGSAGQALPLAAAPSDWADAIHGLTRSPTIWSFAADAAIERATHRFVWDAWAREIGTIARSVLAERHVKAA